VDKKVAVEDIRLNVQFRVVLVLLLVVAHLAVVYRTCANAYANAFALLANAVLVLLAALVAAAVIKEIANSTGLVAAAINLVLLAVAVTDMTAAEANFK